MIFYNFPSLLDSLSPTFIPSTDSEPLAETGILFGAGETEVVLTVFIGPRLA